MANYRSFSWWEECLCQRIQLPLIWLPEAETWLYYTTFSLVFSYFSIKILSSILRNLDRAGRITQSFKWSISFPCLQRKCITQLCRFFISYAYKTEVPNPSLTMYPFRISTDEHIPRKFLMTKKLNKITEIHWMFHRTLSKSSIKFYWIFTNILSCPITDVLSNTRVVSRVGPGFGPGSSITLLKYVGGLAYKTFS